MPRRNFANRTLFKGDNINFLRGMNGETVDLIATDPPFNKSRDFNATPGSLAQGAKFQDRWNWILDVQEPWMDEIKDEQPQVHALIDYVIGGIDNDPKTRRSRGGREDMAAFIAFMAVRVLHMHRVLKPTGSIYLHCDPTASHYLKALLDAVFGDRNFRNEIVWQRTGTKTLASTRYPRDHDIILYYVKSDAAIWNQPYMPYDKAYVASTYRREDKYGKYKTSDLTGGKAGSEASYKPFKGVLPSAGRGWAPPRRDKLPGAARAALPDNYEQLSQLDKCYALDAAGLIYWSRNGKPQAKTYLSEAKGRIVGDIISDITAIGASGKERTGYPTQKPLALYERIIKASSNEGDLVLDPFCGCATTPIAAERLGRQWVGMDLWDGAYEMVMRRMEDNRQILAHPNPQIIYTEQPPVRTDDSDDDPAVFDLDFVEQTPKPRWQRLTHKEMRRELEKAQASAWSDGKLIDCGGCGRSLESAFMELDHITPRSDDGENWITNRILLCRPCNGRKSNILTMPGLRRANKREKWMKDEKVAIAAQERAKSRARQIKREMSGY